MTFDLVTHESQLRAAMLGKRVYVALKWGCESTPIPITPDMAISLMNMAHENFSPIEMLQYDDELHLIDPDG